MNGRGDVWATHIAGRRINDGVVCSSWLKVRCFVRVRLTDLGGHIERASDPHSHSSNDIH